MASLPLGETTQKKQILLQVLPSPQSENEVPQVFLSAALCMLVAYANPLAREGTTERRNESPKAVHFLDKVRHNKRCTHRTLTAA